MSARTVFALVFLDVYGKREGITFRERERNEIEGENCVLPCVRLYGVCACPHVPQGV